MITADMTVRLPDSEHIDRSRAIQLYLADGVTVTVETGATMVGSIGTKTSPTIICGGKDLVYVS